jgi:hypothetical protein
MYCQVYKGFADGQPNNKQYYLKINLDSSLTFIYHTKANDTYEKYLGKIVKLSDTIFRIKASLILGKSDVMQQILVDSLTGKYNDTAYFCLNLENFNNLNPIKIQYSNGFKSEFRASLSGCMALDPRYFNNHKGSNYYMIQTNETDDIDGTKLLFHVSYGSSPDFTKGQIIEFNVVIHDNIIKSIYSSSLPVKRFFLIKSGT